MMSSYLINRLWLISRYWNLSFFFQLHCELRLSFHQIWLEIHYDQTRYWCDIQLIILTARRRRSETPFWGQIDEVRLTFLDYQIYSLSHSWDIRIFLIIISYYPGKLYRGGWEEETKLDLRFPRAWREHNRTKIYFLPRIWYTKA
jgi:hypothetical protein